MGLVPVRSTSESTPRPPSQTPSAEPTRTDTTPAETAPPDFPQPGSPPLGDPHRALDGSRAPASAGYVPGEAVAGEVIVYFAEDPRRVYQLLQWLPVLERLDERHRVLVVLTHPRTYDEVRDSTSLRCVFVPTWPDLAALFEAGDHKVAVYVNNAVANFQMLAAPRMLHVHVNHGESDKVCMVSNQVKAYDRVFVAGEAAVRRYRAALIEFDERALVRVGRPQLDLRPVPVLPPSSRRTILYAPTWEGENASNDYTSVAVHGPAIVAAALAVPDVRVVYKPHPRVATSPTPAIAAAHARIRELLAADPDAGNRDETGSDILAVFDGCDLMVTDVSSVGLDFLYLQTGKPLFIADRYDDRARLHADAPISRAADIVDSSTIGGLTGLLARRLAEDVHRSGRARLRRQYFGDLAPGDATTRFLDAISDAISTRDRALARLDDASLNATAPEGVLPDDVLPEGSLADDLLADDALPDNALPADARHIGTRRDLPALTGAGGLGG